jgi:hypothetical protein
MTVSLSNVVTTRLTKAERKAEMPNNLTEANRSLACQEPHLVAPDRQGYLQARLYRGA